MLNTQEQIPVVESTVVENEIQIELNAATMPIAVEDESSDFQGKSLSSNETDLSL